MKTLHFNWYNTSDRMPIRICISDSLEPLLPHSHDEIELMFFYQSDCCNYLCNSKNFLFSSKDTLVVNSGEIHSCANWGNDCTVACVIINTNMLSDLSIKYVKFLNKIYDMCLTNCFEKLKSVLSDNNLNICETECKIYSIIYDILSILSHYTTYKTNTIHRDDIKEILKYIDVNLCQNITLDILANKSYLSKDRFYHIFKEYTGFSPIKYILKQRIKKSCDLLKNSNMSIQEIALECNFCTSSYFSKKFLEYMKISPSKYRKNIHTHEKISLTF